MEPEDLLENPEFDTLTFDNNRLVADFEIATPTGNIYCVGWVYNGKGPIHRRESYDLDCINKSVNDGANVAQIPFSELEEDLKACGFEQPREVLDILLEKSLERYDVTKPSNR